MASLTKIFGERRLALLVLLLTAGSQVTAANNEERPTAVARLKPASRRFLKSIALIALLLPAIVAQAELIDMSFSGRVTGVAPLLNPPQTIPPFAVGDPVKVKITYDAATPEIILNCFQPGTCASYEFSPGSATVSVTVGGKTSLVDHRISANVGVMLSGLRGCQGFIIQTFTGQLGVSALSHDDFSPPNFGMFFRVDVLAGDPAVPPLLRSDQLPKSNNDLGGLTPSAAVGLCGLSGGAGFSMSFEDVGWRLGADVDPTSIQIGPAGLSGSPILHSSVVALNEAVTVTVTNDNSASSASTTIETEVVQGALVQVQATILSPGAGIQQVFTGLQTGTPASVTSHAIDASGNRSLLAAVVNVTPQPVPQSCPMLASATPPVLLLHGWRADETGLHRF